MAKDDRSFLPATAAVSKKMARLAQIRESIRELVTEEKEVQASLVEFIGNADGAEGSAWRATLSRCQGQVSWKSVTEQLQLKYNVPMLELKSLADENRGDDYVRLLVKEL